MSNKGNINLQLYNGFFKLNFNSFNEESYIKDSYNTFSQLDNYCKTKSCEGYILNVNFESRMQHLELILRLIENVSQNMEFLTEFEINSMLLIINEALSNAVYHGNLNIPENFRSKNTLLQFEKQVKENNPEKLTKKVDLIVDVGKDFFEITVKDNGNGFDYDKLLKKSAPPSPEEETGRGIYILKNSVDFIKFSNKGRTLVMKKEWRTL